MKHVDVLERARGSIAYSRDVLSTLDAKASGLWQLLSHSVRVSACAMLLAASLRRLNGKLAAPPGPALARENRAAFFVLVWYGFFVSRFWSTESLLFNLAPPDWGSLLGGAFVGGHSVEQMRNMRVRDAAAHRAATVVGLARARAAGKQFGRPRVATEEAIRGALAEPGRPGFRVIAKRFGVSLTTVRRISREPPSG